MSPCSRADVAASSWIDALIGAPDTATLSNTLSFASFSSSPTLLVLAWSPCLLRFFLFNSALARLSYPPFLRLPLIYPVLSISLQLQAIKQRQSLLLGKMSCSSTILAPLLVFSSSIHRPLRLHTLPSCFFTLPFLVSSGLSAAHVFKS